MKKIAAGFVVAGLALFATACKQAKETAPPAPANVKAVQDFVKGKKLSVKSVGFYGMLEVNGVKDVEWLNLAELKEEMTKEVATEELSLALQFVNDTAVIVTKNGKTFTGTFAVVSETEDNENETPGIKLKLKYADPDMGFGDMLMNLTFSHTVLGLDDKRIMLQTPRAINKQNLIALMSE